MAMNARFIGKSRPALANGDVFRLFMPGDVELFGLVALASIERKPNSRFPLEKCSLIYLYRPGIRPDNTEVGAVDEFLIPPLITNRLGFTRFGVWERTKSLGPDYTYDARDTFVSGANGEPLDVWSQPQTARKARARLDQVERLVLPAWSNVATSYGLMPVPMIDDMVSDALGIPRALVTADDFA
jgi:hypothetical protein